MQLPPSVILEVVETPPELKGGTATKRPKPARLNTGIEWAQICAAGVVLVIPVVIFFWLIRKYLLMGMTFGVLGRART